MNCRDIDEWLITSGGDPVPADVAEHLSTCADCRELFSSTFGGGSDSIVATGVSAILAETKPVRPLPQPSVLALLFLALCAVIGIAGGVALGAHGFELLTGLQRGAIFGALIAVAIFGALMAARSMRPASGPLYAGQLTVCSLAVPEVVFFAMFSSYDFGQFVHAGLVCLAIGLAFAVPVGLLAWWVMQRGFVVAPVNAGLLAGILGGLAGLVMLEVHCPLLTVPHVGVWHVAVVAVSLALGAGLGRWRPSLLAQSS